MISHVSLDAFRVAVASGPRAAPWLPALVPTRKRRGVDRAVHTNSPRSVEQALASTRGPRRGPGSKPQQRGDTRPQFAAAVTMTASLVQAGLGRWPPHGHHG